MLGKRRKHTAHDCGHDREIQRTAFTRNSRVPDRLHWCTLCEHSNSQDNAKNHDTDDPKPEEEFVPRINQSRSSNFQFKERTIF